MTNFEKVYVDEQQGDYFFFDIKSCYASVELVARNLDPLENMAVVMSGDHHGSGLVLAASPQSKRILGISNVSRGYKKTTKTSKTRTTKRLDKRVA